MALIGKLKDTFSPNMPPMISRAGNRFTLRDAAGNERPPVTQLDVVFVDGNKHMSKIYYENRKYDPNDPLPPDCFSDNGQAPSRFALKPQSESCHTCEFNKRGSAVSQRSGVAVKACTDNHKLAVLVVGDPQRMLYQFVITPGNIKPFENYVRALEGANYEAEDVVTRLTFDSKQMGVLIFEALQEADDEMKRFVTSLVGSPPGSAILPAVKFVVGETDEPIGALPAPKERPALTKAMENLDSAQFGPSNLVAQLEPNANNLKASGPTREQLEAQLKLQREKGKPKLVDPPPADTSGRTDPPKDVPAFLRKKDPPPSNSAFGMTSNAPPPPDEVGKLIDQQTNGQASPTLAARVTKAFGLPLRQ